MADAGVGGAAELAALRREIEALPDDVTAALKGVAHATANRVEVRAKQILASKLKTGATALVNEIKVIDESDRKRFLVVSDAPANQPANLPLWIERGTRFMAARPYMRPAGDAEEGRYQEDMTAVATKVADRLGK